MTPEQQLQRQHMRRRQIGDVDIVADRGTVGGVVIIAEHGEIRHMPLQGHHRARDQMGFDLAQLADAAGRIGAAGVEITQRE